jgi:hypothetical protein
VGRPGAPNHDGIYLGNGYLVHLTGMSKADARVRIDLLAVFAVGRPVTIRPYAGNHAPTQSSPARCLSSAQAVRG